MFAYDLSGFLLLYVNHHIMSIAVLNDTGYVHYMCGGKVMTANVAFENGNNILIGTSTIVRSKSKEETVSYFL